MKITKKLARREGLTEKRKERSGSRVGLGILGSGSMRKEMVMGSKYGKTAPDMKEPGWTIKLMAMENSIMQMVMYMKENGKMIKLMEKENIFMLMALLMKAIGNKTSNMDLELRLGQTMQDMKENMLKERKKEKGNCSLQITLCMKVNSEIMK